MCCGDSMNTFRYTSFDVPSIGQFCYLISSLILCHLFNSIARRRLHQLQRDTLTVKTVSATVFLNCRVIFAGWLSENALNFVWTFYCSPAATQEIYSGQLTTTDVRHQDAIRSYGDSASIGFIWYLLQLSVFCVATRHSSSVVGAKITRH